MAMKLHQRSAQFLCLCAALCLYSLIFFIPLPPQVILNGVQVVDEGIILACCALIFFAFKKNGWGWKILALVLTLVIFTLPLLRLWEIAESNYNVVLGLLPWSDAQNYYSDAFTLLQGGLFGEFSGRRPFFPTFLAILLKFTGGNIQFSIIALTIINGLTCFLFALEIRDNFGSLIGIGVLLLAQIYYRQSSGTLMTEQLGLSLGLIAFTSLIYAIRLRNKWYFGCGLFLLTIALLTRAGAFFVIPIVLILGIILFKEQGRVTPQNMLIFTSAIAVAWGVNAILNNVVVTPGSSSMGNFSYTLYGQAVGGKGWTQVLSDHPEINSLQSYERNQVIYQLALDEIRHNPSGLITGFVKAWKDFFIPSIFSMFGFIQTGEKYSSLIIQIILTILAFIGLFQSWQSRTDGIYLLLLVISGGIFISIPFIPPSEAAYMRVYAVTIAIPTLLACIGLRFIITKWIPYSLPVQPLPSETGLISSGVGTALVLITLVGALLMENSHASHVSSPLKCPDNTIPLEVTLSNGSFISIVTNESGQKTHVPTVSARDFRKSLRAFPGVYNYFSTPLIDTVTPPVLFTYIRNQITGDFLWLITPPELATSIGEIILGCGKPISQNTSIVEVQSFQNIP